MASDSLPTTISDTVTLSEELREEGRIDGQVKLYNIDKSSEFESDAATFFDRTVPTQGLHETLTILRDSLDGEDPRQTHILYGPYGSGKSHQMVALYHCFDDPSAASEWADGTIDGLGDALPEDAIPITVAMQYENNDYDYLWEPFFEALDYDVGSFESGGYPDVQTIEEAVGDRTVAFIADELEDWYDTLDDDRESANRAFLQSLLEATALPDLELYTIVSVLRKGSKVHDILDREDAVEVNMSSKVSKRDVLLHRLIDDVDDEAAREIVNGYVDAYETSDYVEVESGLREEMRETYPLHPELIETLESRYYESDDNQNTRGMIYLFSTLLLELRERTDLITHGDVDAETFEDELSKINFERPSACVSDIENRVRGEVEYGRRVLNTILLYSLNDSHGEGAEVSQIVVGTYQTGNRISDIYINLEQLHGVAWHLHKLNGKYAIREKRNPNALIRNAASDVSVASAKGEIADIVTELFGPGTHTVGFRTDDIRSVPDSRDVKVVVKSDEWGPEEVERVITDDGRGRNWRNTFVFVQPLPDEAIESGTRYIDKARYVEGARQVLADDALDRDIRARIEAMKSQEEEELRKELRRAYGEVVDGDDLLDEFETANPMDLDVFVFDGDEYSARNIASEAAADPFDLRGPTWTITQDLLDRKGETTPEDVYEEFLREPSYPIPGSVGAVIDAAEPALEDKSVLVHTAEDGFDESMDDLTPKTTIVHADPVETWTIEEVEEDLRTQFGGGTDEVDIGEYYEDLLTQTDVRIDGDEKDTLMMAVGRLTSDDAYVVVRGTKLLDEPQLDAAVRDVSEAELIGSAEIRDRIDAAIDRDGRASVERIVREIRGDPDVFLPPERTDTAVRKAVTDCLAENYLLEAGRRYLSDLGDRDPANVTLVPTVSTRVGEEILDYIEGVEPKGKFTVTQVRDRFGSSVSEAAVQTFLLRNLGEETAPEYTVGTNGSSDPSDWMNGYPFKKPGEVETWDFEYQGDSPTEMRKKWRQLHREGQLNYGSIKFVLPGSAGVPEEMRDIAATERTHVDTTLEADQPYTVFSKLFDKVPADATDIRVEMEFRKE
ncbi:DUF499 domain-containing protein [Halorussus salinus]|uniref:DUF499 domain-containing protein n=1 Tax=Halorussus salinus TaxID=1364935 RepID=UPI001092B177|nr:DUF499 domain-containing protein [Halorussus salinus]